MDYIIVGLREHLYRLAKEDRAAQLSACAYSDDAAVVGYLGAGSGSSSQSHQKRRQSRSAWASLAFSSTAGSVVLAPQRGQTVSPCSRIRKTGYAVFTPQLLQGRLICASLT